jgi:hypothetical protein
MRGTTVLDVGVDALVDEARLAVVDILAGPVAQHVVVQCRPALGAAARGLPLQLLHELRDRLQFFGDDQPAHVVVAEIGAAAHRLDGGRIVGLAELRLQQLLDQAGAGAARRRRLGVRPHLIETLQPETGDGARDLALADAVAAADLGIVGQGRDRGRRIERDAAGIVLAEDQRLAHVGDVGAALEQVEEPRAIRRVAVHHRADDAVVLQHQAAVDAARGVAQDDLLAVLGLGEVAGGVEVDAGDLELGRRRARLEARGGIAHELRGRRVRHLVERRHQAEHLAIGLGAFAQGEDIGIAGAHGGVDHDTAVDGDARLLGELHVGADADRHHHQVSRQACAVVELDGLDAARAHDRLGVGPRQHLDAAGLDGALQQMAGGGIELALHQGRHQVHDRDVHALSLQAGGSLEAQKSAADDHGIAA